MVTDHLKKITINVPKKIVYVFIEKMFDTMISHKEEYSSLKGMKYDSIDSIENKRYIFQNKYAGIKITNKFELNEISEEQTEINIIIKGPWLSGKIIIEGPLLTYISNLKALEEAYRSIQEFEKGKKKNK